VALGRCHEVVVRLKGGDPLVFARGGEELEALRDAGVEVEVVPGVSSALGVPSAAGVALTRRGVARAFTVVTGHDAGDDGWDWSRYADDATTLVVLMGASAAGALKSALLAAGRPAATPCAIIERGTLPDERVVATTLDQLDAHAVEAPAVIVVGEAVRSAVA
jgi:siroheme synthase